MLESEFGVNKSMDLHSLASTVQVGGVGAMTCGIFSNHTSDTLVPPQPKILDTDT